MLGEEVPAIEFVALTFDGTLRAGRTAVVCKAEMLRCDVTLPFVLGTEGAGTAGEGEGTGKWPGMCCCNVFPERRRVLEWGMAAQRATGILLWALFLD